MLDHLLGSLRSPASVGLRLTGPEEGAGSVTDAG
jgi:hypothetical protein